MKIHYAYYNQYKNGIDIAFADKTLLFLSCAVAEDGLHTTPNSQRLIDNLAIDDPLTYAALALDGELQGWADAMDEDWEP
ncbi:MAG: toxin-antitoxin system protein [Clostridia bacterium]|nr:toxin-antitoxin system protein [Clostridia bacterium]